MQPDTMPGGRPRTRRRRLGFEGLESRELLSAAPVLGGPNVSPSFAGSPTPLPSFPRGLRPDLALVPQFQAAAFSASPSNSPYAARVALLDAPGPTTDPTPAEVAREYFVAKFEGSYTVGPGRFQGQALTVHAFSRVQGGSNQFLKGKAQILLSTPADPSTGRVTGLVSLFTQNYLQSGNLLIIDVGGTNQPPSTTPTPVQTGGPTVTSNVGGLALPTQVPWAFDATSAGAYTAPSGFTQGGGQLSVVYTPDRHARAGTLGSGKVVFLLQGLINTSSILNVVDKGIN